MIRFSCRCGYVFEAPDDAVGVELQCPQCHVLNDVPFQADLAAIAGDGTYKVDPRKPAKPTDALGDLLNTYGNMGFDAHGRLPALPGAAAAVEEIGAYELPAETARRNRPRYDPETGELVQAIPLGQSDDQTIPIDPSTIPFATQTVNYAVGGTAQAFAAHSLLNLAQPINLVVMSFVFGMHLFIAFWTVAIAMRFLLVAPIVLALVGAIIAHYGNVVDEIGPGEREELPRVLRDLQMGEDVWHPLISILLTAALCYGPAIVFACKSSMPTPTTAAIAGGLALVGTFFMPAILLTLLTSGSAANLRPDRVLGVIGVAAGRYFTLIILFVIAVVPYAWATAAFTIGAYDACNVRLVKLPGWTTMWAVSLPLMCFGIFAMHFFCWQLGILYRLRGDGFPWTNQVHGHNRRQPPPRRKPKYLPAPSGNE